MEVCILFYPSSWTKFLKPKLEKSFQRAKPMTCSLSYMDALTPGATPGRFSINDLQKKLSELTFGKRWWLRVLILGRPWNQRFFPSSLSSFFPKFHPVSKSMSQLDNANTCSAVPKVFNPSSEGQMNLRSMYRREKWTGVDLLGKLLTCKWLLHTDC